MNSFIVPRRCCRVLNMYFPEPLFVCFILFFSIKIIIIHYNIIYTIAIENDLCLWYFRQIKKKKNSLQVLDVPTPEYSFSKCQRGAFWSKYDQDSIMFWTRSHVAPIHGYIMALGFTVLRVTNSIDIIMIKVSECGKWAGYNSVTVYNLIIVCWHVRKILFVLYYIIVSRAVWGLKLPAKHMLDVV